MTTSMVIAVGGNSLIRAGQRGTQDEQAEAAFAMADGIARLVESGSRVAITHGNGPQVGAQLLRSEAAEEAYPVPLDVCVAMTQGEIGYILQRALHMAMRLRHLQTPVATLITQVLVDPADPAFKTPNKPVGPFYDRETATKKIAGLGWDMIEDASRGYRRVVSCPKPRGIVEIDVIRKCFSRGFVVMAAGGGGIPVVERGDRLEGIEAVIDKDRTSALLASLLRVNTLVMLTGVPEVCTDFHGPNQKPIHWMNADTANQYLAEGQFAEGSMKPKIEAGLDFLSNGGSDVIITSPELLLYAVEGKAGTRITALEENKMAGMKRAG